MLTSDEKKIIQDILEIEDQIFYKQNTLHEKIIENAKKRKQAKEMTILACVYERDGDPHEFYSYLEKEIKRRINILIYKKSMDDTIPDNFYADRSWIFHLVEHGDCKLLQKYLFRNGIASLEMHPPEEDLLFQCIKTNNFDIAKCLIKYKCIISANLIQHFDENEIKSPEEEQIKQLIISEYEKDAICSQVCNIQKKINKYKDEF